MVFIIGIWGGEDRVYAAVKFVVYTLVGSLLMLVGVLWLGFEAGDAVNNGVFTTDWYKLASYGVPLGARRRGCSSCSGWRSRSRSRCSRSTPGCPTPTPRRRRADPSCWPACC